MISIDFEFESQYGRYADALLLPDDHGLSNEEIEQMKQQRFTSWLASVEAASQGIIDGE